MYLRKNRNSFSDVSLNEPIANEKDGSEITLMDAIAAPEQRSVWEQIVLEERLKQLQAFLPLLDERELLIIKRFGLHGRKEQTEGDRAGLGISALILAHRKARVSQAVSCLPPPGEERGFPINCCFLRRRML
ncbi:MAG: hypothetical protein ACLTCB_01815 [Merdibacter sp.]